jgi:hypothetical protein
MHKIVILPVVMYECETWSLAFREEYKVFRNVFGPEKDLFFQNITELGT